MTINPKLLEVVLQQQQQANQQSDDAFGMPVEKALEELGKIMAKLPKKSKIPLPAATCPADVEYLVRELYLEGKAEAQVLLALANQDRERAIQIWMEAPMGHVFTTEDLKKASNGCKQ